MDGNNMEVFGSRYLATMQRYAELEKTIKDLNKTKDQVREELKDAMEHYGIRSIDNEFVKVTLVAPSVSVSLDSAALRIARPDQYEELVHRFPKRVERKSSLRVTVK